MAVDTLVEMIAEMREQDALARVKQLLDDHTDPTTILDDCRAAMEIVGKQFEHGEYFLPELILAGDLLKQISDLVKPHMHHAREIQKHGKVLIGTVKGDIHDIGKDLVVFMLDVNGFEVHDLGVDVPPQKFVQKIAEVKPDVVALSGFLTVTFAAMKQTIDAIRAAGLRDQIKIMIGGGTIDDHVRVFAGADAFGKDAMAAVALAQQWTGQN
ncbi:MAG: cobalamin B12-binding domain-containing protein [Chloroflexi bacterium]|nr:cobalamin B12-binding domain-containing protein [Chloroflexota bacterium]